MMVMMYFLDLLGLVTLHAALGGSWVLDFHH